MSEKDYERISNLRTEKGFAYMRWLMLIATGAFTLTANAILTKQYQDEMALVIKSALTANIVGIFFGAIAIYGESMLYRGAARMIADREIAKIRGDYEKLKNFPEWYSLPSIMRIMETLFYLALTISLFFWLCFVWMQ